MPFNEAQTIVEIWRSWSVCCSHRITIIDRLSVVGWWMTREQTRPPPIIRSSLKTSNYGNRTALLTFTTWATIVLASVT